MGVSVNHRFGFDVGTNSLGWCVLELDKQGETPVRMEAAGVRVFSDGRDLKDRTKTLKAERREARSARRRRDRFKQRQRFLLAELRQAGLFPDGQKDMGNLQRLNPLELRTMALKEKLSPWEIGRALFHLNQRRGFKSNRKDQSEEKVSGVVARSVLSLLQEMDLVTEQGGRDERHDKEERESRGQDPGREIVLQALMKLQKNRGSSYGSFLYDRQLAGRPTRARRNADDNGKLYDVYPRRELYEDEFHKIWEKQAPHHPGLMTEGARVRIYRAIFYQRPLKVPEIGHCVFLPDQKRTFRAMPSFQRYRMYREVNNLEWRDSSDWGRTRRVMDHPDARNAIIDLLEKDKTKQKMVKWTKMGRILRKLGLSGSDVHFNYEDTSPGLECNLTSKLMRADGCVGAQWDEWSVKRQDEFIEVILMPEESGGDTVERSDDEVRKELMSRFHLSEEVADRCLNAPLPDGVAGLSLQATHLLTRKMESMPLHEAIEAIAEENERFKKPCSGARRGTILPSLPYYGEAFQGRGHIIPGNREPGEKDDLKYYGGVPNPTVHIALNQVRRVVNELIRRYGHPHSIAIELARDLPAGKQGLARIKEKRKENREKMEEADKILQASGQTINRDNRTRVLLWKEQGEQCPYSGKKIDLSDLFSTEMEIDHILPYSRSLDDGSMNKVVCTRRSNRDKGNKAPFEAFSHSPGDYDWYAISQRTGHLPRKKFWRFTEGACRELSAGFLVSHLDDTRYIGRLTKEYFENVCAFDKIDVVTGRLTGLLRARWRLNGILKELDTRRRPARADRSGDRNSKRPSMKNSDDHRHQAIDAIVTGLTTRSLVQKMSEEASRAEQAKHEHSFTKVGRKSSMEPWKNFRGDVRNVISGIIVSHRAKRKMGGRLHKDSAYGIARRRDRDELNEQETDVPQKMMVVMRKAITEFKRKKHLEGIRDPTLRRQFMDVFEDAEYVGDEGPDAVLRLARAKGIRRLRVTLRRTVHPVRDRKGNIYKSFWLRINWAKEIYEYPEGHGEAGKWVYATIPRYEANQKGFLKGVTRRPHPAARLVMRLFMDDCVEIDSGGERRIFRVQKMSKGRIVVCQHQAANCANRLADLVRDGLALDIADSRLQRLRARKVHVSPTGLVNYDGGGASKGTGHELCRFSEEGEGN